MPTNDLLMNIISPIAVIAIVGVVLSVVLNVLTRKLKGQTSPSKSRKAHSDPPENAKTKVSAQELIERGDAYVSKAQVMTPSEQLAYRVIEEKYRDRFFIFAQMRVVDVIQPNTELHPKNSKEYNALFRQLSQWHFDFVLCYREDFRVCCAIELDDPSHQQKARQKRDRILNRVCEVAGVRLERMKLNYEKKIVERAWYARS